MQAKDWCDQGMHLLEDDNISEAFHSRLSDFSASRYSLDDLETLKSSLDGIFTPFLEVVVTILLLINSFHSVVLKMILVEVFLMLVSSQLFVPLSRSK